jgi:hypothetical protein
MKIARQFLAALIFVGSLTAAITAASAEDWTEAAWHAHIQELRQLNY